MFNKWLRAFLYFSLSKCSRELLIREKGGLGCGSSGEEPALQVRTPEFKLQDQERRKRERKG
jgi:hypothetical protein